MLLPLGLMDEGHSESMLTGSTNIHGEQVVDCVGARWDGRNVAESAVHGGLFNKMVRFRPRGSDTFPPVTGLFPPPVPVSSTMFHQLVPQSFHLIPPSSTELTHQLHLYTLLSSHPASFGSHTLHVLRWVCAGHSTARCGLRAVRVPYRHRDRAHQWKKTQNRENYTVMLVQLVAEQWRETQEQGKNHRCLHRSACGQATENMFSHTLNEHYSVVFLVLSLLPLLCPGSEVSVAQHTLHSSDAPKTFLLSKS